MYNKNANKYIKFSIISILLVFLSYTTKSQSRKDSLEALWVTQSEANGNSQKTAQILIELYDETSSTQPLLALQYAAQAQQAYYELQDSVGVGEMDILIGDNYFQRKDFNMAIRYYSKSADIFNALQKQEKLAYCYLNIGKAEFGLKLSTNAHDNFQKALRLFEKIGSEKGKSFIYDNLAIEKLYSEDDEDEKAFALLDSSLLIRKKIRDYELIALSYENIADAFFYIEEFDSVAVYLQKALVKYKVTGNQLKEADTYYRFGEKYLIDEKYNKSKAYFKKAFDIYKKSRVTKKIALTYDKLSFIDLQNKDFEAAKNKSLKALILSRQYDFKEIRKNAYKTLSDIYYQSGSFEKSREYLSWYINLSDSLVNETHRQQSQELQFNLANQKTEQEMQILRKNDELNEIALKKNEADQNLLYAGILILVIILAFFVIFGFYLYRTGIKRKRANHLLIEKNEEINKQKELISKHNERITSSINYAGRIQRAMLPKMKEVREKLTDSFVMLSPRDTVSGDFFWYGDFIDNDGNEKIMITAIDCTGHGVPGAFMSMIADAYLNQIVYQQNIHSPENILTALHEGIVRALQQKKTNNTDGMDMAICVIDKKNRVLEYAGAKNPFVYIQDGEMKIIKGDQHSIGGMIKRNQRDYKKHIIDISKPTMCYIYSDGFQDQFGGKANKKYMAKRFRKFLYDIHVQPIHQQAVSLAVELDEWKGERSQMDDILVIGFRP